MQQIDFIAATLPVVELTESGLLVPLGQATGVTMRRYRRGQGFAWTGHWKTLELDDPTLRVQVLRWTPERILVQQVAREAEGS